MMLNELKSLSLVFKCENRTKCAYLKKKSIDCRFLFVSLWVKSYNHDTRNKNQELPIV